MGRRRPAAAAAADSRRARRAAMDDASGGGGGGSEPSSPGEGCSAGLDAASAVAQRRKRRHPLSELLVEAERHLEVAEHDLELAR